MIVTINPEPAPEVDEATIRQQVNGSNRPHGGSSRNLRQKAPWDVRAFVFVWSLLRAPVWYAWHFDSLYTTARMTWLPKVWSFAMAHRKGWFIFRGEPARRAKACGTCAFRRDTPIGQYCVVHAQTCGCPKTKRYPFSKLPYLRRLRAWTCPIGAFEKRG